MENWRSAEAYGRIAEPLAGLHSRRVEGSRPDWFQFEDLPAYSPELNSAEQRWNYTKYSDLANFLPDDLDPLEAA